MDNDEQFYATVADEMEKGQIDKALWTKAFAHSGGEETATKSHYCRLRAEQLQRQAKQQNRSVQVGHAKTHGKQLGFGLFLLAIGLAVSAASYNAAEPGARYVVASGLTLSGFVITCRALWGLLRSPFVGSAPAGTPTQPTTEQAAESTPTPLSTPSTPKAEKPGQISTETGCLIIIMSAGIIVVVLVLLLANK